MQCTINLDNLIHGRGVRYLSFFFNYLISLLNHVFHFKLSAFLLDTGFYNILFFFVILPTMYPTISVYCLLFKTSFELEVLGLQNNIK